MYGVNKHIISKSKYPELWEYLHRQCRLSKNLRNACIFRLRQSFTMRGKNSLSDNEAFVLDEIDTTVTRYNVRKPKGIMSYVFLEKLMRATDNPDFFAGLPMQSAQAVLKGSCESFTGWFELLKSFNADPSRFTGKPKMPGYVKGSEYKVTFDVPDNFKDYFNGGWSFGTAKLVSLKGKWYLHIPVTKDMSDSFDPSAPKHVVGIDRGLRFIASTYDQLPIT